MLALSASKGCEADIKDEEGAGADGQGDAEIAAPDQIANSGKMESNVKGARYHRPTAASAPTLADLLSLDFNLKPGQLAGHLNLSGNLSFPGTLDDIQLDLSFALV